MKRLNHSFAKDIETILSKLNSDFALLKKSGVDQHVKDLAQDEMQDQAARLSEILLSDIWIEEQ